MIWSEQVINPQVRFACIIFITSRVKYILRGLKEAEANWFQFSISDGFSCSFVFCIVLLFFQSFKKRQFSTIRKWEMLLLTNHGKVNGDHVHLFILFPIFLDCRILNSTVRQEMEPNLVYFKQSNRLFARKLPRKLKRNRETI